MSEEQTLSLAALTGAFDVAWRGTKACITKCEVIKKGGDELTDSQKECLGIIIFLCKN